MAPRWSRPPQVDESGRLSPEERARAKRRVLRSLAALVVVAVLAGLLAYGCDHLRHKAAKRTGLPGRVTLSHQNHASVAGH